MRRFLLYGVFTWIGAFTPWAYILAYVVVILGFAWLYQRSSSEFYHPYVKYETSMGEEATEIVESLNLAFREAIGQETHLTPRIRIDPDSVSVPSIEPDKSSLLVKLKFKLLVDAPQGHGEMHQDLHFRLDLHGRMITFHPDGEAKDVFFFPEMDLEKDTHLVGLLADISKEDPKEIGQKLSSRLRKIRVSPADTMRMQAFNSAYAGFPHAVRGGYGRMVYLSAVTITTLGYGDIVPLTTRTRVLTAIEATLGIILLGLFISSMLAKREEPVKQTG